QRAPPPRSAAHTADATVVFPMPISPTARRSLSDGTVRYPMSTAARNSSAFIADAAVISPVGRSRSMGTTRRSARARSASRSLAEPPREVRHHLFRDGLRVSRDAPRHHTVIACKDADGHAHLGDGFGPRAHPGQGDGLPRTELLRMDRATAQRYCRGARS